MSHLRHNAESHRTERTPANERGTWRAVRDGDGYLRIVHPNGMRLLIGDREAKRLIAKLKALGC